MDKNKFFKKNGLRPSEEQRLLTKPFYRNANVIYQHFEEWKDKDRFYFIPLYVSGDDLLHQWRSLRASP